MNMHIHLTVQPIISLLAGFFILAMPESLNYVIAIYLIVIGVAGLLS
jgi:threonine/homoserine efflux transporter RhtA